MLMCYETDAGLVVMGSPSKRTGGRVCLITSPVFGKCHCTGNEVLYSMYSSLYIEYLQYAQVPPPVMPYLPYSILEQLSQSKRHPL